MRGAHITKIPASWAEVDTSGGTNGWSNGYTNGHSGHDHVNGDTNGHEDGADMLPKNFLDGKAVRTVYGLVPLKYALDWPIFASYDELAGGAAGGGGGGPAGGGARSGGAGV